MNGKTALVLGASGLVGNHLLQLLLESEFEKIWVVVRKALPIKHPKLIQIINDFEQLQSIEITEKVSVLFSCLGTTRAKTPELNAYKKIEVDIPAHFIQMLTPQGLEQVHYISAIGVKPNAKNFYLNLKAQAEEMIMNTAVNTIYIYRPSLIIGERKDKRFMESLAGNVFALINPLLFGKAKKYRSIAAKDIAQKLLYNAIHTQSGKHIVYFDGK